MKFLKDVYCSIEYFISEVQKFAWPLLFYHTVAVVAQSGISQVACRVAREQQMYFQLSLLSLQKIMSTNLSGKTMSVT